MSLPRIIIICESDLESKLDVFKAAVEADMPPPAKIQDKPKDWKREKDKQRPNKWVTFNDVRFKAVADADLMWSKMVAKKDVYALQGNGIMSYHQCSHLDGRIVDCRSDIISAYQEVKFGA